MTGLHVAEPLFGGYLAETVRWPMHDYAAAGWTFVTLCTADRVPLFGSVEDGVVRLSDVGRIADETFRAIPDHEPHVAVDALVVMPDHVHVLIGLMHRPDAEKTSHAEETRHGTSPRAHPPHPTVETRHGASPPTSDPALMSDPTLTSDRMSTSAPTSASGLTSTSGPPPSPVHGAPGWIPPAAPLATPRAFGGLPAGSVSSVVNQAKGAVTRAARRAGHAGFRWQPRFHDRVVRSARELDHVRQYIADNPARWTSP